MGLDAVFSLLAQARVVSFREREFVRESLAEVEPKQLCQ